MKERKEEKIKEIIPATSGPKAYVSRNRDDEIYVKYIEYDKDKYYIEDIKGDKIEDFLGDRHGKIKWLSIVGIKDQGKIKSLCLPLNLHTLVIEDILDTDKNTKIDDYNDYLFLIVKRMYYTDEMELGIEQISFLLFKDRLVSFQEFESDIFKDIENRLREGGNIRKSMGDDLLYFLLDAIVDDYFILLKDIGEKIDIIEDELLIDPDKEILEKIYLLKRDLIYIRNSLWPMRNMANKLSKAEYDLIDGKTVYYMRDISDSVIQVIDLVEIYREVCSGMLDTYLSSIGNKTNQVMKVLTVFSTIFIPLSFLAGVYGMNFKYIPELNWKFSYHTFWIISILLTVFMLRYFKKKDWF